MVPRKISGKGNSITPRKKERRDESVLSRTQEREKCGKEIKDIYEPNQGKRIDRH